MNQANNRTGPKATSQPLRDPTEWKTGDEPITASQRDDQGRSLSADRRRNAKTRVRAGQGDRGDR